MSLVSQATIDTLELEIAGLKESASEKQAEITKLEKECGLDVKSKVKVQDVLARFPTVLAVLSFFRAHMSTASAMYSSHEHA